MNFWSTLASRRFDKGGYALIGGCLSKLETLFLLASAILALVLWKIVIGVWATGLTTMMMVLFFITAGLGLNHIGRLRSRVRYSTWIHFLFVIGTITFWCMDAGMIVLIAANADVELWVILVAGAAEVAGMSYIVQAARMRDLNSYTVGAIGFWITDVIVNVLVVSTVTDARLSDLSAGSVALVVWLGVIALYMAMDHPKD